MIIKELDAAADIVNPVDDDDGLRKRMQQSRADKSVHISVCPKLTKRETEVLRWIAAGKSTREISTLLNISEHGVIHHVRNLLLKFAAKSRHQVVLKAFALGLLDVCEILCLRM